MPGLEDYAPIASMIVLMPLAQGTWDISFSSSSFWEDWALVMLKCYPKLVSTTFEFSMLNLYKTFSRYEPCDRNKLIFFSFLQILMLKILLVGSKSFISNFLFNSDFIFFFWIFDLSLLATKNHLHKEIIIHRRYLKHALWKHNYHIFFLRNLS